MFAMTRIAMAASSLGGPSGQIEFTAAGTYNWIVPAGVTSICAVLVQGGNEGPSTLTYNSVLYCRAENGNRIGDGGGDGGWYGSYYYANGYYTYGGGGGAGGYAGNGGQGGDGPQGAGRPGAANSGAGAGGMGAVYRSFETSYGFPGGGVGLKGIGATGTTSGQAGSGGEDGGKYGGAPAGSAPGGALSYKNNIPVTPGTTITVVITGNGGGRIIWGPGRAYPGTDTADKFVANEVPTSWSFTYSSLWTPANAPTQAKLMDGTSATYFGTAADSAPRLTADFGANKILSWIKFTSAPASGSWSPDDTNNTQVHTSTDGANWTLQATLSGASETVLSTVTLAAPVLARYVRFTKGPSYMGFGELYFG